MRSACIIHYNTIDTSILPCCFETGYVISNEMHLTCNIARQFISISNYRSLPRYYKVPGCESRWKKEQTNDSSISINIFRIEKMNRVMVIAQY